MDGEEKLWEGVEGFMVSRDQLLVEDVDRLVGVGFRLVVAKKYGLVGWDGRVKSAMDEVTAPTDWALD
jgi:hypothetical protein